MFKKIALLYFILLLLKKMKERVYAIIENSMRCILFYAK